MTVADSRMGCFCGSAVSFKAEVPGISEFIFARSAKNEL
jgi:hypothetical protein